MSEVTASSGGEGTTVHYDPMAVATEPAEDEEPAEETLPVKPSIDDMPPEEGVEPPTEAEELETVAGEEPLDHTQAEADDTIDNAEEETYPEDSPGVPAPDTSPPEQSEGEDEDDGA